jgi:vacuolar-type H+-ATPase subunit H
VGIFVFPSSGVTMDRSDYVKNLNRARQDFFTKTNQLRDSHRREIEHKDKVNEQNIKNVSRNYSDDLMKKEKEHQDLSANLAKKTERAIEESQNKYLESLEKEKKNFNTRNLDTRREFSDRLDELGRNYNKSINSTKNYADQKIKVAEENSKNRIERTTNQHHNQVKELQQNNRNIIDKVQKDSQEDKMEFMNKLREDRDVFVQDMITNQEKNRLKNEERLSFLKKEYDKKFDVMEEGYENTLKNQKSKNSNLMTDQNESINKREDVLRNRNLKEMANLRDEYETISAKNNRQYKRDLADLKDMSNRRVEAKDSLLTQERKNHDTTKNLYKNKMADQETLTRSRLTDQYNQFQRANDLNREANEDQKRVFNQKLEVQAKENYKKLSDVNNKSKEERTKIQKDNLKKMTEQEKKYTNQMIEQRNASKKEVENHKNILRSTINALTDSTRKEISVLNNSFQKEKTKIIEKSKKDRYNLAEEKMDEFRQKLGLIERTYESRLNKKNNDVQKMKEEYDRRIKFLGDKAVEAIRDERERVAEKRADDFRAYKRTLQAKDLENAKALIKMRSRFEMDIEKIKKETELHINKLTNRHDRELNQTKRDNNKKMKVKVAMMEDEYRRSQKNHALAMANMKNQYELRLEKMRQANEYEKEKFAERSAHLASMRNDSE